MLLKDFRELLWDKELVQLFIDGEAINEIGRYEFVDDKYLNMEVEWLEPSLNLEGKAFLKFHLSND